MQYRRAKTPGSSYFFTLVTHNRCSILGEPANIDLLRDSFQRVIQKHPYGLVISPKDWQDSSFHRFVERGVYDLNWGASEIPVFDVDTGME